MYSYLVIVPAEGSKVEASSEKIFRTFHGSVVQNGWRSGGSYICRLGRGQVERRLCISDIGRLKVIINGEVVVASEEGLL